MKPLLAGLNYVDYLRLLLLPFLASSALAATLATTLAAASLAVPPASTFSGVDQHCGDGMQRIDGKRRMRRRRVLPEGPRRDVGRPHPAESRWATNGTFP